MKKGNRNLLPQPRKDFTYLKCCNLVLKLPYQKYGYTLLNIYLITKEKLSSDTFLENKSELYSHNFNFTHFPKMGFLGLSQKF